MGTALIFYIENPRLKGHGITIPLRGEKTNLHSFVLDVSVDIELIMNTVIIAQVWHLRRGHPDERTLEFMQWHDGNGIPFNETFVDYDVSPWETSSIGLPQEGRYQGAFPACVRRFGGAIYSSST